MHYIQKIKQLSIAFIRSLGWKKFTLALMGGFLLGVLIFGALLGTPSQEEDETQSSTFVTVRTVSQLSSGATSLSLIGEIKSLSGATVFSESAGIIQFVSYELGDYVTSGAVIAEIENSTQRASVQSARANLNKIQASFSRDASQVYVDAKNTYRNSFTLASDAIFGKTDTFFSGPRTSDPRLTISQFGKSTIENTRAHINDTLGQWEINLENVTDERVVQYLEDAQQDLSTIKLFLDQLATIVSRQGASAALTQTQIDADKAALFSARSNTDTALTSVSASLDALRQTLPTQSGGTGEANAQIDGAVANLNSALAQLEKTIVRAPVSGTLNALNIEAGDFVGTFTEVASIANNDALEIVAFIGAHDREFVTPGSPVLVEGDYRGVVTKVAPALNPITKKLEIKIGLIDDAPELLNGSSVRLSIFPNQEGVQALETLFVPIEALKLTNAETVVFGVDNKQTLVAYPVTLGQIVGNSVEVKGIEQDLPIVIDARGLRAGQKVEVRNIN